MRGRPRARGSEGMMAYLAEIDATPLLSDGEEADLAGRVAAGDPEARDHMVRANLRLVVRIAREYLGRGLSLEDLVAEGNLGLMRAVEGFDAARGHRFSTYAAFWIKQSLRAALQKQGTPVRLPSYAHTLVVRWRRAAAALREQLGREPTAAEVGDALKLSRCKRRRAAEALRASGLRASPRGGDYSDEDGADLGLAAAEEYGPEHRAIEGEVRAWLLGRLAELEAREALVLRLRFGLDSEGPLTLSGVGDRLGGLTRERVRQLERQALARLAPGPAPV